MVGILQIAGRRAPRYIMRARDIMSTPVVTVPESATLERVARLMLERKIGCVPVVGADGTLRGILTDSDFSAKARPVPFSLLRLPSVLGHWLGPAVERAYQEARTISARDVMTAHVVTVNEADTVEEAIRRMYEHNIHRLPVVRDGKPLGMVTRQNLLRLLLPAGGKPGGAVEAASSVPAPLGA